MVRIASAVMALSAPLAAAYSVLHELPAVDYRWESPTARQAAIESGDFIMENNVITGLKACNVDVSPKCTESSNETRLFATVPRWLRGVPATLSEVVTSDKGVTVLKPWPSLEAQDPRDCSKIQYVQSMEITPDGLMWVLDVGRKYFNDPAAFDNSCPPKMVLLDVASKEVVDTYVFPSDVAPYTGSFLNDIVVDVVGQIAYVSSTGTNVTDRGAVVMYDRFAKVSRRFEHPSTHAEDRVFHVHEFQNKGVPTDGIALTPDRQRVFYSALSGLGLYSISTDAFQHGGSIEESLISHGDKPDISDGMAFGSDGSLFFGGLQTNAIYRWHPDSDQPVSAAEKLAQDSEELYWVDTFAFDNRGQLLVTSNKLAAFFDRALNFTQPNFRIISLDVGVESYMKSTHANATLV